MLVFHLSEGLSQQTLLGRRTTTLSDSTDYYLNHKRVTLNMNNIVIYLFFSCAQTFGSKVHRHINIYLYITSNVQHLEKFP